MEEVNVMMKGNIDSLRECLGAESDYLLKYTCTKIKKESLHTPGPDFIDQIFLTLTDQPR